MERREQPRRISLEEAEAELKKAVGADPDLAEAEFDVFFRDDSPVLQGMEQADRDKLRGRYSSVERVLAALPKDESAKGEPATAERSPRHAKRDQNSKRARRAKRGLIDLVADPEEEAEKRASQHTASAEAGDAVVETPAPEPDETNDLLAALAVPDVVAPTDEAPRAEAAVAKVVRAERPEPAAETKREKAPRIWQVKGYRMHQDTDGHWYLTEQQTKWTPPIASRPDLRGRFQDFPPEPTLIEIPPEWLDAVNGSVEVRQRIELFCKQQRDLLDEDPKDGGLQIRLVPDRGDVHVFWQYGVEGSTEPKTEDMLLSPDNWVQTNEDGSPKGSPEAIGAANVDALPNDIWELAQRHFSHRHREDVPPEDNLFQSEAWREYYGIAKHSKKWHIISERLKELGSPDNLPPLPERPRTAEERFYSATGQAIDTAVAELGDSIPAEGQHDELVRAVAALENSLPDRLEAAMKDDGEALALARDMLTQERVREQIQDRILEKMGRTLSPPPPPESAPKEELRPIETTPTPEADAETAEDRVYDALDWAVSTAVAELGDSIPAEGQREELVRTVAAVENSLPKRLESVLEPSDLTLAQDFLAREKMRARIQDMILEKMGRVLPPPARPEQARVETTERPEEEGLTEARDRVGEAIASTIESLVAIADSLKPAKGVKEGAVELVQQIERDLPNYLPRALGSADVTLAKKMLEERRTRRRIHQTIVDELGLRRADVPFEDSPKTDRIVESPRPEKAVNGPEIISGIESEAELQEELELMVQDALLKAGTVSGASITESGETEFARKTALTLLSALKKHGYRTNLLTYDPARKELRIPNRKQLYQTIIKLFG
ncbi:MAG: hypothetical protein PHT12_01145 [Patescibacteria group bacterium]|nr:hypothetical protein [Patescibacteria group bacterium]